MKAQPSNITDVMPPLPNWNTGKRCSYLLIFYRGATVTKLFMGIKFNWKAWTFHFSSSSSLVCFYVYNTANWKGQPNFCSTGKSKRERQQLKAYKRRKQCLIQYQTQKSKCLSSSSKAPSPDLRVCQKVMRSLWRTSQGGIQKYWMWIESGFQESLAKYFTVNNTCNSFQILQSNVSLLSW